MAGAGVDAGATCQFSAAAAESPTITCTDDGTYEVTLSVSDGIADPVSDTTNVIVENLPPVVGPITVSPADLIEIGTTIQSAAGFNDPGTADTHSCTINWGDAPEDVDEMVANGQCGGSHTYTSPGVYTIVMEVVDDDGGTGSATYQFIVVYDPNGDFVTGGGWINSPSGAYTADASHW